VSDRDGRPSPAGDRGAPALSVEHLSKRFGDRVAILNTTLRTIGRPAELREQLFAKTLTVRTLVALPDPGGVFADLPAVDGWRQDGPATYVLAVSEQAVAAR
jgi:ABC-2 type transport system ATP-binding protein